MLEATHLWDDLARLQVDMEVAFPWHGQRAEVEGDEAEGEEVVDHSALSSLSVLHYSSSPRKSCVIPTALGIGICIYER